MTLAATAPVSDNHTAIWVVLALLTVFAIVAVLWQHETVSDRHGRAINDHDEQLATLAYQMPALLDWLGVEIPAPVADDSPEALAAEEKPCIDHECVGVQVCPRCGGPAVCAYDTCGCDEPDDCPTDEFPIAPATVPDGMPLAVQSALIEQRPSPVPRETEYVERTVNIGGTARSFRIPVSREDAP